MKFSEYLSKNNIKQEEAAKALEVSQPTVSRWLQGDFIPERDAMQRIIIYTNGEVKPNDFYDVKE